METHCVICKTLLQTKILALEQLNRIDKYFDQFALFAGRKKLVDYLVAY